MSLDTGIVYLQFEHLAEVVKRHESISNSIGEEALHGRAALALLYPELSDDGKVHEGLSSCVAEVALLFRFDCDQYCTRREL